jgi:hypothetical protein
MTAVVMSVVLRGNSQSRGVATSAPAEVATSKEGARVVLVELDRAKTPLQAMVAKYHP